MRKRNPQEVVAEWEGKTDTDELFELRQYVNGMYYGQLSDLETGFPNCAITTEKRADIDDWLFNHDISTIFWGDGRVSNLRETYRHRHRRNVSPVKNPHSKHKKSSSPYCYYRNILYNPRKLIDDEEIEYFLSPYYSVIDHGFNPFSMLSDLRDENPVLKQEGIDDCFETFLYLYKDVDSEGYFDWIDFWEKRYKGKCR